MEICPAQYSHHFIFLEIFSGIACNHFHHHSPLSTLVCALCPFHRFHLSFAGNYHLILVKIFLHLDGRTLTSASKVEICRQASSSHHQIVIWICFCIKKKVKVLRRQFCCILILHLSISYYRSSLQYDAMQPAYRPLRDAFRKINGIKWEKFPSGQTH